jgi:hypothetical protein
MKQALLKTCVLLGTILYVISAKQAFGGKFNTETSSSTRALSMGNAAINTERGAYALFYNPANIAAKNTGATFQLFNFQLDGSLPYLENVGAFQVANPSNLSALYQKLDGRTDSYNGARYSVYPNLTVRNFSLGFLYEVNNGALIRSSDNSLIAKSRNRMGPTAALSFRLFGGILRFGASAQYMTVGNANETIAPPVNTGTLDYRDISYSGAGLITTGGVTLTLPFRYLPSFSLVARNIGGSNFSGKPLTSFGTRRNVPNEDMTVDLATSATIYLGRRIELKIEGDYRDALLTMPGSKPMDRLFAGMDLAFFDVFRLRAGWMNRYPTGGIGIYAPKGTLDVAWYSDRIDDGIKSHRDMRFALQYTFNFFGSSRK